MLSRRLVVIRCAYAKGVAKSVKLRREIDSSDGLDHKRLPKQQKDDSSDSEPLTTGRCIAASSGRELPVREASYARHAMRRL